ncbi:MAG: hypothetical protein AAB592_04955 [Patescibacteria group bacterium]
MDAAIFLEEYAKLKNAVPRVALINTKSENSAYTQYSISNRNVYICWGCEENEDSYYGYWLYTNKDAVDSSFAYNTEITYECVDVRRSYNIYYSQDLSDCRDMFLCLDCVGSSDCFGCVGLRQKQFQIFNVQYEKEDYHREVARLRDEWSDEERRRLIRENFLQLKEKTPHIYMHQINAEHCTGDYIYNSRNCIWSFDIRNCEDSQYIYNTFDIKDCQDCSYVKDGQLMYECVSAFGQNFNYCYVCWGGANLDFCELCFNCQDMIGCIGLRNKRFCILNKQYTEEEYRRVTSELKKNLCLAGIYQGKLPQIFWDG